MNALLAFDPIESENPLTVYMIDWTEWYLLLHVAELRVYVTRFGLELLRIRTRRMDVTLHYRLSIHRTDRVHRLSPVQVRKLRSRRALIWRRHPER